MLVCFGRSVLALGFVVLISSSAVGHSAALGNVSATSLMARTVVGAPVLPSLIAWEDFDGTNGAALAGTTTDVGAKSWTAPRCTWSLASNKAKSTSGDCPLLINAATVNLSTEVKLFRNGATAWDAGVVFDANSAATKFLTVEYTSASNGSIEIWKYTGSWVSLGSTTNLYPSGVATAPASITLRVVAAAPVSPATVGEIRVSVSVDGVQRLAVTLSAADQTTFKAAAQSFAGPYTYNDSSSSFDSFLAEAP